MDLSRAVALATERVVAPVAGMHRAIAAPWLKLLGPAGKAYDSMLGGIYGSVRAGGAAVGAALDATTSLQPRTTDAVQAALNGLWGDTLGPDEDRLAIPMSIRPWSESVATDRLVVLVHGLAETERCWCGNEVEPGLAEALAEHPGLTALPVRYNSGLPVGDNGENLAALLEELHAAWPVRPQSIALVGHSMGGLVIRRACASATASGHDWIGDVSDVVTLGSPHRGAPLEKLFNVAAWGLGAAPQTAPLADFLNGRSAGIQDLRFGDVDQPLAEGVDHHFVAGVVTADPEHPLGVVMGDLLVRTASGTARGRLEPTNVVVVGGANHVELLRDPRVIDHVMDWLVGS